MTMGNKIKRVNIHAGHNPDGKIACGAVGLIKESTEARYIRKMITKLLRAAGITVYNCTCNNGTSQTDVLKKIVQKCNAHDVDLDVSIHFNSGRGDRTGDNRIGGTEVLMRKEEGIKKTVGSLICKQMEKIGFTNRGIKISQGLYFLNHTKAPAVLIEVCFVDDKDDVKLYKASKEAVANGIAKAIIKALETD